ncbi:inner membrane-spanning protein YciB [Rickettsia endosymbiont of Cardiosporidium cionae]|uniref:inner membrane-spanning protein YciB n=1 Tax=Rickettsia endosymbiont of Cardiosporidium cionae TaxID=2777155 RepID=UPI0018953673|nr:septation protein IspZ [Rickettsia endosymbiont of Cardiosporidium cionae]KAF8818824.1 septation protein A [Rickettsia endosymbiont of Cardiosporidium cionae]
MSVFLIDFCPFLAFFIGYYIHANLLFAGIYASCISILAVAVCYIYKKSVTRIQFFSLFVLLFSTFLTLMTGNTLFIKIKPTIIYCTISSILFISLFYEITALEYLMGKKLVFKDRIYWKYLTIRFAIFFFLMAILNEFVWRFFGNDIWVKFKVVFTLPLVFVFIIFQVPFIIRNKL